MFTKISGLFQRMKLRLSFGTSTLTAEDMQMWLCNLCNGDLEHMQIVIFNQHQCQCDKICFVDDILFCLHKIGQKIHSGWLAYMWKAYKLLETCF